MNRSWVKPLVLVALIAAGLALVRWGPVGRHVQPEEIAAFIRGLGSPAWAPLAFVLVYALGTTLGLPGSALTLTGGALFGVAAGSALNWLGACLGAMMAFFLARGLGREWVERLLRGRAAALDERIGSHGFRTILYLRLIPLIPFNGLNFSAGLTRVRWRDYALGTAIGIVPGTLIYTVFADALIRGSAEARSTAFVHFAIAASALVAFTLLTDWIRKRIEGRARSASAPGSGAH